MQKYSRKFIAIILGALLLLVPSAIAISIVIFPTYVSGPANMMPNVTANDSASEIDFGDYIVGHTIYSKNELVICNVGSIPYEVFIAGTDYNIANGSCPSSNTMSIQNMEYYLNGTWSDIYRYDTNKPCVDGLQCRTAFNNLLKTLASSECISLRFRLNIPSPCTGTFTSGGDIYILTEKIN